MPNASSARPICARSAKASNCNLRESNDVFPEASFYGCLGYKGRSLYHAILGSQTPENERPMNSYFGVEEEYIEGDETPQVMRKRNALFECPSDRGDAYFKLADRYFVEHGSSYTYASDSLDPFVPTFGIMSCRGLPLTKVKFTAKKIVFQEPVFNPSFDMTDGRARWHHDSKHHGQRALRGQPRRVQVHEAVRLHAPAGRERGVLLGGFRAATYQSRDRKGAVS